LTSLRLTLPLCERLQARVIPVLLLPSRARTHEGVASGHARAQASMIAELLSPSVVVVETEQDLVDTPLFPDEERSLGCVVDRRRREFVTVRACARSALVRLGMVPSAVPKGERGEPVWPPGVVGSLTHCSGYRACAVAKRKDIASIGIDAEPREALPPGVREQVIATDRERLLLADSDSDLCVDRLLFSAKEAVFKAWFPLTHRWLGFEDAELTFGVQDRTFEASFLVCGPVVGGKRLHRVRGRWKAVGDLLLTAVVVTAPR
jgi:4'-phosphopantetheinyl transferase EntD